MALQKEILPVEVIPFDGDACHLFIKARAENRVVRLLLDTGASKTLLSEEFVKKTLAQHRRSRNMIPSTGLGSNQIESEWMVLSKLSFGKLVIRSFTCAVLNLQHVNDTYTGAGLRPIQGVLGSDLLLRYRAVLDYDKKVLVLKGA